MCGMALFRRCYFYKLLNGTRKFQMPLNIFIEKEKKSLPQYEAPLPRQTHQEVCKKGRSACLHNAGTHGQAHTYTLQFLQCLKNRNGHTNVFLHVWTVSLPTLAQPGLAIASFQLVLFSRYFYILQVWETGYPVLTDILHQAPAGSLFRCHPLRRHKFTVTQMTSRSVFATHILPDYPFGLWLTAPERGQVRMFVSKECSFVHSKVYRLKKKKACRRFTPFARKLLESM